MGHERVYALTILAAALGALALAWHVAPPLVLGFALAAALDGPTAWITRRTGCRRSVGATAVLAALVLVFGLIGFWAGAQLIHELALVRLRAPEIGQTARRVGEEWLRRLGGMSVSRVFGLAHDQRGTLARVASRLAVRLLHGLGRLPAVFGTIVLSVLVTYVALLEGPLSRPFRRMRQSPFGGLAMTTLGAAGGAAWRLVSTELLLASYTAAVSTVLFAILGASVPVLLGVLAGLCDLVPYAGPAILYLPWAVVLLTTGHHLRGVEVLCAWGLLAGSRAVFELRWVGRGVGLSPLWVLVSFYLGGRLGGFPGILLGPVVAAAVWGVFAAEAPRPGGPQSGRTPGRSKEGDATWNSGGPKAADTGTAPSGGAAASWSGGVARSAARQTEPWMWRFWERRDRSASRRSTW